MDAELVEAPALRQAQGAAQGTGLMMFAAGAADVAPGETRSAGEFGQSMSGTEHCFHGSGGHIQGGHDPDDEKTHAAAGSNLRIRVRAKNNTRPRDYQRQGQPVYGRRPEQMMKHRQRTAHARRMKAYLPSWVRPGGDKPQHDIAEHKRTYRRRRVRGPQQDKSHEATCGTHQQRLPATGSN